ncbi:coadhesin-like [Dreissena polymorpha]|uniref:coadhesin-like n=1 Tax=Dreissena polymorpha TaxID=45954 RepID=UPI002264C783|nr:coadhesin-like [Dreissena polymorpha]
MRQFLAVLVFAGCLIHGVIGAIYCTVDDDTPVFSAPDLGTRVVTLVERNTCFNGDMDGEWLVLQDNPIYFIHGYTVIYDIDPAADKTEANVNGAWGAWQGWSFCACNGFRGRYRPCDSPPPTNGGQDCQAWSTCSVSCENGTQSRNRKCYGTAYGGKDCGSDDSAFRNCSTSVPCPVSGGWSTWSNWSVCSATCQATGMQYRNRSRDSPSPGNGGQNCTGDVGDIRNCNGTGPCPVDGGYSNWLQWSNCSATCEGGVRYRSRYCNEPRPQNGGSDCSVLGKNYEASPMSTGDISCCAEDSLTGH